MNASLLEKIIWHLFVNIASIKANILKSNPTDDLLGICNPLIETSGFTSNNIGFVPSIPENTDIPLACSK